MKIFTFARLLAHEYSALLVSVILCFLYFILEYDFLQRRIGEYFIAYSVISLSAALISFGISTTLMTLKMRILSSIVSPFLGALIGYTALSFLYYFHHGFFFKGNFFEWLFTAVVSVFFMTKMWWISLVFLFSTLAVKFARSEEI